MKEHSKMNKIQTEETAKKLVTSMGFRNAISYCQTNQWSGIVREIRKIRDTRKLH